MADYLLWIDFETTGLGDDCRLVEVAATLTTAGLDVLLTGEWLLSDVPAHVFGLADDPAGPVVDVADRDPWDGVERAAMEMHETSGLANDWRAAVAAGALTSSGRVEQALCAWVDGLPASDDDPARVMVAGSGVERFDRRLITRRWRELDRRLHYACFDVSPVRRVLGMTPWAGAVADEMYALAQSADHRARHDVAAALAQARALYAAGYLPTGKVHADV